MSSERTQKLASKNYWDELIALRDRQRAEAKDGLQVIKRMELPQENNQFGLIRWYVHPTIRDTVIRSQLFYEIELPPGGRSGRLKFQGGQVLYVIEGKGHTLINGVKHPWNAEDVVALPIRLEGIIIQHVNDDPQKSARLVVTEPNFTDCVGVDRGSGFELLEASSAFKRR